VSECLTDWWGRAGHRAVRLHNRLEADQRESNDECALPLHDRRRCVARKPEEEDAQVRPGAVRDVRTPEEALAGTATDASVLKVAMMAITANVESRFHLRVARKPWKRRQIATFFSS
jgi:hypothetical protein